MGGKLAGSCEAPREVMRPGLRQGDGVEGMALRELKGWITWGPMERAWGGVGGRTGSKGPVRKRKFGKKTMS